MEIRNTWTLINKIMYTLLTLPVSYHGNTVDSD